LIGSKIPRGVKQNVNHRNYLRIPNNKYQRIRQIDGPPTSNLKKQNNNMTSEITGNVNDQHGLLKKADHSAHFFETRLVKPWNVFNGKKTMPKFERTTMKIAMENKNQWPSYVFTNSALPYANQVTTHYTTNVGFRNKPTVILKKSTTTMIYKIYSDQPWKCRQIVWTSGEVGPYNRPRTCGVDEKPDGKECELTNNMATMTVDKDNKAQWNWNEELLQTRQDNMNVTNAKSITNILQCPLNTKYPGPAFYYAPNDGIAVILDKTIEIPGKPQHLESMIWEDKAWEKGPGEVEYLDVIGRGGAVNSVTMEVKHQQNWHTMFIWQPCGDYCGNPLELSEENPRNFLEVDIIHTLHWEQ
jgi:hypothetical protein